MLAAILALLTAIPGIGAIVTGVTGAMFNAKVKLYQAKTGATRDVAVTAIQTLAVDSHEQTQRMGIIAASKPLLFLVLGFAIPWIVIEWKVVVVDKVIGPGCIWFTSACWIASTDPVGGTIGEWGPTIIAWLFGSGTALAVTHVATSTIRDIWGKE